MRLRVVCLDDTGGAAAGGSPAIGANARRAIEDSTTVAYVGELDPAATRFSRPILEAAGIAQVSGDARAQAAMARVLKAIDDAGDTGQLREAVAANDLPASGLEQVPQRLVEVGVAELVAEVEGPPRHHPLAAPQHRPELACRI